MPSWLCRGVEIWRKGGWWCSGSWRGAPAPFVEAQTLPGLCASARLCLQGRERKRLHSVLLIKQRVRSWCKEFLALYLIVWVIFIFLKLDRFMGCWTLPGSVLQLHLNFFFLVLFIDFFSSLKKVIIYVRSFLEYGCFVCF